MTLTKLLALNGSETWRLSRPVSLGACLTASGPEGVEVSQPWDNSAAIAANSASVPAERDIGTSLSTKQWRVAPPPAINELPRGQLSSLAWASAAGQMRSRLRRGL